MKNFSQELVFKTSRSSGAGGQNVNKVETSVAALWDVDKSLVFNEEEKTLIRKKLKNRISSKGILQVSCEEFRTQQQNRKQAVLRAMLLVNNALIRPKPRKKMQVSAAQKEKRLKIKKLNSEKKENRKFRL